MKKLILISVLIFGIIFSTIFAYNLGDTSFLSEAINVRRMLKPNEVQLLKDNFQYINDTKVNIPPVCTGANKGLIWDGTTWHCNTY